MVPCGGKGSRQVDVRGSREQRRATEIIIADFKFNSLMDDQGPKTFIQHKDVRIDLQDPRSFEMVESVGVIYNFS